MSANRLNMGSLIGGVLLIAVGLISLVGQFFRGFDFWGTIWPFFVIGAGCLFFIGMVSGGKSAAGLAIPGAIVTTIGLMLFIQNVTDYWQSWAYGWTVIIMSVGLGIYIMGRYTDNDGQKQSGLRVVKVGAVLFIFFGGFFETIFDSFGVSKFLFPLALIAIGSYLLVRRSGILPRGMPAEKLEVTNDGNGELS